MHSNFQQNFHYGWNFVSLFQAIANNAPNIVIMHIVDYYHIITRIMLSPDIRSLWAFKMLTLDKRETYFIWMELCYFMSVWNTLPYLLVSIMSLSQDKVTIIFTVKFKINILHFEFDAYHVILPGGSGLKLFVGDVYLIVYSVTIHWYSNTIEYISIRYINLFKIHE